MKEGETKMLHEWNEYVLSDVADIIDSLHQTPQYSNTGISMVRVTDIKGGYLRLDDTVKVDIDTYNVFIKNHKPQKGDIVISRVGSYGFFSYVMTEEPFCLGQNTAIISPKVNNSFLYYSLLSPKTKNYIEKIATGSTQKTISLKDIKNIPILLPENITQVKISSILSAIDEKIAVNEQINDNLLQQSIVLFDSCYFHSDSIPQRPLSDIATIKYGKGLPTKELLLTGFPVFGGNGIIGRYSSYLYENPQILVSCRGAASGNILVSYPQSFVTNNSLILELNDYRYFHFVKQYLLENPLHSYATGSAQPQITIDNIKDVQIPYPDFESIQNITEQLSIYADMQYHNICENSVLCSAKDALLPQLMSGRLDVSSITV